MDGECSDDGAMSPAGRPGSLVPLSPSPTGRRRSAQKRVVTVPLADASGPRTKGVGEGSTQTTDSWAWRKYGQKPIKGSPYPRAYYRCSSFKGCPARKQVERSRADPAMVIITCSFEHNHSGPASGSQSREFQKPKPRPCPPEPEDAPAVEVHDEFRWLYDVVSVASTLPSDEADGILYGPMFLDTSATSGLLPDECGDVVGVSGAEGSDEDALFVGLDELPECATVFRRRACGLPGGVKAEQAPEGAAVS